MAATATAAAAVAVVSRARTAAVVRNTCLTAPGTATFFAGACSSLSSSVISTAAAVPRQGKVQSSRFSVLSSPTKMTTTTTTTTSLASSKLPSSLSSSSSSFARHGSRFRSRPLQVQVRGQGRRGYADSGSSGSNGGSGDGVSGSGSGSGLYWTLGLAGVAGAGYYAYSNGLFSQDKMTGKVEEGKEKADAAARKLKKEVDPGTFSKSKGDYQAVYNHVAKLLEERDEYEDGSYGPLLVRLAWHCSGTYDKETGTGGSNGATMRFPPEGDHGANAGLKLAREFLEPVKERFPWISYSDLWTLAGVAAIQEMQGPLIPWRPGRSDRDVAFCTPDGRLPDGSKDQSHLRAIFGRMGFNDAEIVALSGAHALGRCHPDRSGFEGPWTFSPTVLTNEYFRLLMDEKWNVRKWPGPKQYQDENSKSLMMLPTDMALVRDNDFKKHVKRFAEDEAAFFREFADVVMRLFELGVPFATMGGGAGGEDGRMRFQPLNERDEGDE